MNNFSQEPERRTIVDVTGLNRFLSRMYAVSYTHLRAHETS